MSKGANHPVKAVTKSLAIIEALRENGGLRLTELATALELHKSTVHNHLSTLRDYGYVVKQGEQYQLSLKFLEVGGQRRQELELYSAAMDEMQDLASESGELVNLLVEDRGKGTYVAQIYGDEAVEVDTYVGIRTPLNATALGKAVLAYLSDDHVEQIINRHGLPAETEQTITSREELFEVREQIRNRGYAIDNEERLRGLRCVAAPIMAQDRVHGAISVSAPTSRMSGTAFDEEIPSIVKSAANVIEINLEYSK